MNCLKPKYRNNFLNVKLLPWFFIYGHDIYNQLRAVLLVPAICISDLFPPL